MPVCALDGAVVEIFLETAPHMRGTVTPPLPPTRGEALNEACIVLDDR